MFSITAKNDLSKLRDSAQDLYGFLQTRISASEVLHLEFLCYLFSERILNSLKLFDILCAESDRDAINALDFPAGLTARSLTTDYLHLANIQRKVMEVFRDEKFEELKERAEINGPEGSDWKAFWALVGRLNTIADESSIDLLLDFVKQTLEFIEDGVVVRGTVTRPAAERIYRFVNERFPSLLASPSKTDTDKPEVQKSKTNITNSSNELYNFKPGDLGVDFKPLYSLFESYRVWSTYDHVSILYECFFKEYSVEQKVKAYEEFILSMRYFVAHMLELLDFHSVDLDSREEYRSRFDSQIGELSGRMKLPA